jgi:hypothetical protein
MFRSPGNSRPVNLPGLINAGSNRLFPELHPQLGLSIEVAFAAEAVKTLAKLLLHLDVHRSTHSPARRFHVDVAGGPVKMSRNEPGTWTGEF